MMNKANQEKHPDPYYDLMPIDELEAVLRYAYSDDLSTPGALESLQGFSLRFQERRPDRRELAEYGEALVQIERDERIYEKCYQVWKRALSDPLYAYLFRERGDLEPDFEAVLANLPQQVGDFICEYIQKCEALNGRLLELACEEILFPDHFRANT